jgi:glycosyltransferase involved in cell wall biosynthesis
MSIYLISCERRIDQQSRVSVGLLRNLERWACSMPDMLILDTEDYVLWFNATYAIPEERFRLVPTGADDTAFKPLKNSPPDNSLFRLIYYGTFIPNHGVAHIVEAALLLKDHADIVFELIGTGPDRYNAEALAKIYGLKNILFTDWLDQKVLVSRIAQADACLGAFGTTTQSLMTIQNKIFEGLAMGKPVISGDSPAVRKVFENKKHIYLCQRANSQSIAHAIIDLKSNSELRKKLSEEGNKLFLQTFSIQQIGTLFKKHLCNLISKGNDEK